MFGASHTPIFNASQGELKRFLKKLSDACEKQFKQMLKARDEGPLRRRHGDGPRMDHGWTMDCFRGVRVNSRPLEAMRGGG